MSSSCIILFFLLLTIISVQTAIVKTQENTWKTKYFEQRVDHNDYRVNSLGSFKQRYLINGNSYKGGNFPIFFYTGNEGDITLFAKNTGLIWEFAAHFNALIIFAEHRYYGESLPFGSHSFANNSMLAFFTAEQALQDYVTLIEYLKATVASTNSPVVAFGGSYGGMLSAWLRMKYPGTVVGAYAASAPIWQFTSLTPCETFNSIVTRTYRGTNSNCPLNIRNSWKAIRGIFERGQPAKLKSLFHLCDDIKDKDELNALIAAINNVWVSMAMADYPYPANFLGNLPAWPVNYTCNILSKSPANEDALLMLISEAVQVFTNYSKDVKCFNIANGGDPPALSTNGWDYQSCTQMVMPMCSDGKNDMFEVQNWDFDAMTQYCIKEFRAVPREFWAVQTFGGKEAVAKAASNIYFTNGHLDPWSGGGVLTQLSPSLHAFVISDGAHHVDLRASNPHDTTAIKQARSIAKSLITKWVS
ncbi:Lysosomal Pro-X carboxypeptidase [Oopsacas minuta]|uniref:Lysosomal Pro-X carboxypeptidase n=1 Tax=Oopsacas minuta TaxID=111878 RepID=A0AAV7JXH1_9METZ|nr:Lysosomal Pro-X carboxypeptidase [Oopsacas minuta]